MRPAASTSKPSRNALQPPLDEFHAIPLTIAQAFPEVDQFDIQTIIASSQKITYDLSHMQTVANQYFSSTANELAPYRLFASYIRDRNQIPPDVTKSPILTDLQPDLEYYFLNAPIVTPIRSKGNFEELLLNRIAGCDTFCQQEILNFVE